MSLNKDSLKPKETKATVSTDSFIEGASTHSAGLDPSAKANQSFTVPMNAYELSLLRRVAELNDRSMRKVGRRLFAKILLAELEELEPK